MTHVRWAVCALLFAATTINYLDRQVIGLLKPTLQARFGWTEIDYGNITAAFQAAYALGYAVGGRLVDLLGVRVGLAAAVLVWSLASAAHGLARTVVGFSAARVALGLGEGVNFPASVRTIAMWFPPRDRAFATGVFNAGSNLGAIVAPVAVPTLTVLFGWPSAFVATGVLGLLWLAVWLVLFRTPERHRTVSAGELALIRVGADATRTAAPRLPWRRVLVLRGTIAFAIADVLVGPVWWFYLFWIPDFLHRSYGLDLRALGPPLVAIYLLSDVGSIAGGYLSSALIRLGLRPLRARVIALAACAVLVVPVALVPHVHGLWPATLLIALAAAAHQGFAANLYTVVSDTVPVDAVASAVGIGGMASAIAGMGAAGITGHVLQATGSYMGLFLAAPAAYGVAVAVVAVMLCRGAAPTPRQEPAAPGPA